VKEGEKMRVREKN